MKKQTKSTIRNKPMHKSKEVNLKELFIKELRDLYNAEHQLTKTLPKLSEAASSDELKEAFDEHLQVTQEHVNRLAKILMDLDEKPTGIKCKGMEGLIEEGKETLEEKSSPIMKDLGLIAAAQKVEHYEIASYGTVRTFADILGLDEAADLLQQTLSEEKDADKTLTEISENLLSHEDMQQEEGANWESHLTENERNSRVII